MASLTEAYETEVAPDVDAPSTRVQLPLRCLAEVAGTGFIVLGLCLISAANQGLVTSSVLIGLVIALAVHTMQDVSGAQFNPAVTLALAAGDSLPVAEVPAMLASQAVGACVAALAWALLGGALEPPQLPTVGAELALSAALVFGAFGVGERVKAGAVSNDEAPALVGSLICCLNLFFSRLGATFNPAIALGFRAAAAATGGGAAELRGASAWALGSCAGGVLGAALLALCVGRGGGLYARMARLGRGGEAPKEPEIELFVLY